MKKIITVLMALFVTTSFLNATAFATKPDTVPQQNLDKLNQNKTEIIYFMPGLSMGMDESFGFMNYYSWRGPEVDTVINGVQSKNYPPITGPVKRLQEAHAEDTARNPEFKGFFQIGNKATITIDTVEGDYPYYKKVDNIEAWQVTNPISDPYNMENAIVPLDLKKDENGKYVIQSNSLGSWKHFNQQMGDSKYVSLVIVRMYAGNSASEMAFLLKPANEKEIIIRDERSQIPYITRNITGEGLVG